MGMLHFKSVGKSTKEPAKELHDCSVTFTLTYIDASGKEQETSYEKDCYEVAKLSKVFEGMMEASEEIQARTFKSMSIPLNNTTPETFELAFRLEEDTRAVRLLSVQDVLEVVGFYHKYDFPRGLEICDCILDEYICSHPVTNYKLPTDDLNMLVDAMAASEKFMLTKSKTSSKNFVASRFDTKAIDEHDCMTAIIFSQDHIQKLKPLMDDSGMRGSKQSFLNTFSDEEWKSDNFAELCESRLAIRYKKRALPKLKNLEMVVSGSNCEADGVYRFSSYRNHFYAVKDDKFEIKRGPNGGLGWGIYRAGQLLWNSPTSSNNQMKYPPKQGWVAIHGETTPKIQYIES